MSEGACDGCKRRAVLAPLHGPEKGGPLRCYICAGAWHAEHGRRRKMGRVVIRAIRAYVDGGGSWSDMKKLETTALFSDGAFGLGIDPLGYLADTAKTADEAILLTSELLVDILRLVHPDHHPPERADLANRVTQQLLALQPFVFPALKPKPKPSLADGSVKDAGDDLIKPSRYPCADCASTVPYFYCSPCKAEFKKRGREEQERDNAKQRKWYAQRKERLAGWQLAMGKLPIPCASCGTAIKGKRKDARFCSVACRQRAHRKDVTDKNSCTVRLQNNRDIDHDGRARRAAE